MAAKITGRQAMMMEGSKAGHDLELKLTQLLYPSLQI